MVFKTNIETDTKENNNFRKVLFTGKNIQLVVMSLLPNEEIGNEMHENVDQFFRVEEGSLKFVIDNGAEEITAGEDEVVIIPAGTWHNVINYGSTSAKLYTIYAPANHPDKTVHETKADAMKAEEEHGN